MEQKTGLVLIAEERLRQKTQLEITDEKDDQLIEGELSIAAACYAVDETNAKVVMPNGTDAWPLAVGRDKRDGLDRMRKLVIAGALIAAEIDRVQRSMDAKTAGER